MRSFSVIHHFRQFMRPKRLALVEACVIGLVSALSASFMAWGVGWLGGWRVQASHIFPAWLILPAIGGVGALLSGWLIEREAPEASGSGMSQVKAVLARVPLPLNLRVALVKTISAILALGSGLALGREGPTVQVGAALAAQLSQWIPTSPEHRRQLLAAGAGAGLAAAFNAPIGGVLFVAEELLQDVSGSALGTAILASFIGSSVSRILGGNSLDVHLDVTGPPASFSVVEIPLYLLLGVLVGGFGVLFNHGILSSLKFNRRIHLSLPWRMALAGLISGLIIALLPDFFRNNAGLKELLLAGDTDAHVAVIAFAMQFILILVAYGSGAPGGLLVPTLVLGAALGYGLGAYQSHFWHLGLPTTYAHVGMAAFMGATAKAPITAIVLVFEMTRDFNLVLPLMIGSVTAYLVSEKLFPGSFYDKILELNGIYLEKEETPQGVLVELTAANVMQRRVETLSSQMTLDEAVQAFSRSHHRGFPVIDQGRLVGIVTQTDIATMNQQQLSGAAPLSQIMTPAPITVNCSDSLSEVLYLLNRYKLSRLPVTEGRKLVGIITRTDIIRAESDHLSGKALEVGPQSEPSYVVYQTRSPAVGQGRLLVPLANPQSAAALLQLAATIARDRNYELECLQIILVSRNNSPAETKVRSTQSRRLLQQAERIGREWQIPIHTQIRVAHDIAEAMLETIKERHIDLILMGWEGRTTTPGRIFGNVVDTVIRQVACEVVLVKLAGQTTQFDRWLVPIAGGPNAQQAVRLLPALTALSQNPKIQLCQIFPKDASRPDPAQLRQDAYFLKRQIQASINILTLQAESTAEAIVKLAQAQQDDVIILGASRESLLQHVFKGNIPQAIARNSNCTVILVRDKIAASTAVG